MNSNKILFITSEFPPQPGGIGNHALNLALSFQKEGKQVTVLSDIRSKDGKQEKEFDAQLTFLVKRIKRRKIIVLSYFNRFIKALKLINSADTVLASGKFSLWLVYFLSLFYKKKYIAIIHGSEVLLPNKFQRNFTNKSLKVFKCVIAVSNYTKSLIDNLSLENIVVIPNGINMPELKTENASKCNPNTLHLITVGNITQRKGQHNVIKTIPLLLKKYPNLMYHIVGLPTEKEKIVKLAKELEVTSHIKLYGKVTEREKWKLLLSSSIFIMLSEVTNEGSVEGFGIAILEANSIGIPSIGSKNCGIEDAIDNDKSGVLVNGQNSEMILKAVNNICDTYEVYSKNAKNWSKNFSWDKIVKQYIEAIDK